MFGLRNVSVLSMLKLISLFLLWGKEKHRFSQLVTLKYIAWYESDSAALQEQLPRTLAVKARYPMRLWSTCGVGKRSHLALSRKGRGTAVVVGTQSPGSACKASMSRFTAT